MDIYYRNHWREKRLAGQRLRRAVWLAFGLDLAVFLALQPYRPVLVVGSSMLPALQNMQVLLARRLDGPLQLGQVVVANWDDEQIVKRVAGLAGDRGLPGMFPGQILRNGQVYLLGDNSRVSEDSRAFGPLRESDVAMRVVFPVQSGPGR